MIQTIRNGIRGLAAAIRGRAMRQVLPALLLGAAAHSAQAGCWVPEFDEGYTWVCSTPTATWVSPSGSTSIAYGQPITLTVRAALGVDDESPASLVRVEFFVNGTPVSSVPVSGAQATASYTWTPSGSGSFTVSARAVDNGGNHGAGHPAGTLTSGARSDITIRVNQKPWVNLTSPYNGLIVAGPSGYVPLAVTAGDADGSVSRVEYFANGNLVATATSAPFSAGWSGAPAGTYLITARVVDNEGESSVGTGAYVRVNALPSVSLPPPANGGFLGNAPGSIALIPNLSDPDGVYIKRVEYYVNGAKAFESTANTTGVQHRFDWSNIPYGSYSVFARAFDADDQWSDSAPITVRVNALPSIGWAAPGSGTVYPGPSATIAMSASASDPDSGVNRVEFYANDTHVGTATGAPYAFNWGGIPAGTYVLKARVVDNDGAVAVSGSVTVRVNALPSISLPAPGNGGFLGNAPGGYAIVPALNDDGPYITRVEYFANGSKLGESWASSAGTQHRFDWSNIPAGTYSIVARALDTDDQTTDSAPITVRVNAMPSISWSAPGTGTVYPGPSATIPMSVAASDPDTGVNRVEYFANDTWINTATSAPYAFNWTGVPAGTYVLRARVVDNDGAVVNSGSVTVRVNSPPGASLSQPANGGLIGNAPASLALIPSVSDADGGYIKRVEYYVNGSKIAESTANSSGVQHRFDWTSIPYGTYSVLVRAFDLDDQWVDSAPISVRVNALPTISWQAPAANTLYPTSPATIAMSAVAADVDSGVKRVEFLANEAVVGTATSAPYAFSWGGVQPGSYALRARVVDNDNTTADTGSVTVRVNGAPSVSLTAPSANASLVGGGTIAVTANASDDIGLKRVEFYIDGVNVGNATAAPYRFDWTGASAGTHTLYARAVDTDDVATQTPTISVSVNMAPQVTLDPLPSFIQQGQYQVLLTAKASVVGGSITKIEYFANGASVGSSNGVDFPDYRVNWGPFSSAATYSVIARATSSQGVVMDSAAQTVSVGPNTPPTVAWVQPTGSVTVNYPASIMLKATASDTTGGLAYVNFQACANSQGTGCAIFGVGTRNGNEFTYQWDNETPGTYFVKAVATDIYNTMSETPVRAVTIVDTTTGTPPVIPGAGTVGTIPGDVSVDASGAANYSVALPLPPGTAGMVPSVGLSYSSKAGTGVLAYGWSITGFSAITRCGLSRAIDNPAAPYAAGLGTSAKTRVNLDERDQFCLDGQRLILVSGTHGATAEYRTEIDSGALIKSFGTNASKGPDRWEVWQRNGRITELGGTADSKLEAVSKGNQPWVMWHANRVRDRRSNFYTIEYQQNAARGEIYPVAMRYTGNSAAGGFAPYHSVRFIYDAADRLDPLEGYVVGVPVSSRKRLNKVQAVMDTAADGTGGLDVREWRLTYRINPVNGRSLVETIQDCARLAKDGGSAYECMPATSFQYSERTEADNSFGTPSNWGGPDLRLTDLERTQLSKLNAAKERVRANGVFGDFNGDGMLDIASAYGEGAWQVCLSTGTAFNCQSWAAPGSSREAVIGDFNGDGAADFVLKPTSVVNNAGTWTVCLSTRTGFDCHNWQAPYGNVTVTDLDADGQDDLLIQVVPGDLYSCRSNAGNFTCQVLPPVGVDDYTTVFGSGMECDNLEFGDPNQCSLTRDGAFDGSGRMGKFRVAGDLRVGGWAYKYCQLTTSGVNCQTVTPAITEPILNVATRGPMTGQLNSDGVDSYSDIVLVHGGKPTGAEVCFTLPGGFASCYPETGPTQAEICKSTGTGFECKALPAPARGGDYAFQSISDIDGDGFPDGLSNGRVCQLGSAGTRCDDFVYPSISGSMLDIKYADFNGDGHIDYAVHTRTTDNWTVVLGKLSTPDLLIKVTNGLGNVTQVDYENLRNPAIYVKDTDAVYPIRDVINGTMVVSKVRRDDGRGTGATRDTSYRYGGAKSDIAGRGYLGFRWRETLDESLHVRTRTEVSQSFPYIGRPVLVTETHVPTGVELSRVVNTPAEIITANASGDQPRIHWPYVSGSTQTLKEMNSGAVVSTSTVSGVSLDGYGNELTRTTTQVGGGQTFSETVSSTIANNATDWLIGLPSATTVKRTAPGYTDVTRSKGYTYTAYGELETETVESGDTTGALKSVTTKLRNGNVVGAVTGTQVQWKERSAGVSSWPEDGTDQTRTIETLGYDSRWRFVTQTTNALNQTAKQSHDDRTGQPTLTTDANDISVAHLYDGFGRVLKQTNADGTYTTTTQAACASSCGTARTQSTVSSFASNGTSLSAPVTVFGDSLGRLVRWSSLTFDGRTRVGEREYDANGQVARKARTRFSSDSPVWTSFDYDDLGRLTQTDGPTGTSRVAHDGLRMTLTNEKSQQRIEEKNAIGKLALSQDHYGKQTRYAYEPFGNLAKVTDPLGNVISVTYDVLGRKVQMSDPDLGTWSYDLNALGQLRTQTDAKIQKLQVRYDALGRMVQRVSADQTAFWVFDTGTKGIGKLAEAYTQFLNKDYQRLHVYDSLGRPLRTTERLDIDYVVETAYSAQTGRVDSVQYRRQPKGGAVGSGTGIQVDYGYNDRGYLSQLSVGGQSVWKADAMDALDRLLMQTYGNGVKTKWVYRADDARLQYILAGKADPNGDPDATVQNDTYLFDAVGNLDYRAQWNSSGGLLQESFTYDNLNRITSSQVLGQPIRSYAYDDIGNLRSKDGLGTLNYPMSGAGSVRPHALSSVTGTVAGQTDPSFQYDANGNLKVGLGRTVEWTGTNMPRLVSKASGMGPGTATTAQAYDQFVYGPEQQRIKQTATISSGPNAGVTTIWYGGGVEKETRSADNLTQVRTYLAQGVILTERYAGATADVTSASGATREIRYFLKDRLGSTVAVTDEAGAVVERQFYDVWGQRRNGDGSDNLASGSKDFRFGYTGQEHLDAVGLIHMNGRVYDPLLARFMSADPTVPDPTNGQNLNRFSYVLNNPLSYTDPSGFAQLPVSEGGSKIDTECALKSLPTSGCHPFAVSAEATGSTKPVEELNEKSFVGASSDGAVKDSEAQKLPTVVISKKTERSGWRERLTETFQTPVRGAAKVTNDEQKIELIREMGVASGKLTSELELRAFNFWAKPPPESNGVMRLSVKEFTDIVKLGVVNKRRVTETTWRGLNVKAAQVDTYGLKDYDYVIGRATIYFYKDVPIGLSDTYDFNDGERSLLAEFATRATNNMRPSTARDFKIEYP